MYVISNRATTTKKQYIFTINSHVLMDCNPMEYDNCVKGRNSCTGVPCKTIEWVTKVIKK